MAMITCRECGKQISDTADICPHCGAKVNQITVKSSASSKHLIIYATLIILGAFVFFVGLGIFFDDINTYYPHYNYRSPLTSHESQVISTIVVGFALCMLGTYKTFKSMSFPKIGNGSHLSTSTVIPMNHAVLYAVLEIISVQNFVANAEHRCKIQHLDIHLVINK